MNELVKLIEGANRRQHFELAIVFSSSHVLGGFLDLCNRCGVSPDSIRSDIRSMFTGGSYLSASEILARAML